MTNTNQKAIVTKFLNDASDIDMKSLQHQLRQPSKESLDAALSNNDTWFKGDTDSPETNFKDKLQSIIKTDMNWRYNHEQRANQIDTATDVINNLDEKTVTTLKKYFDVDNDYDLIDTLGDYDELFESDEREVQDEKDVLKSNLVSMQTQIEQDTAQAMAEESPTELLANFNSGLDDLSEDTKQDNPEQ